MADAQTIAAFSLGLPAAVAFAYVGLLLAQRPLASEHRAAGRAFALAWLAASLTTLLSLVVDAAYLAGVLTPGVGLVAAWANLVFGLVLLGGIVAYLAYLLTGSPLAVPLVAAFYAIQLAAVSTLLALMEPVGASPTGWSIRFEFANGPAEANGWIAIALMAPALAASLGYLGMLPRAGSATARWRIGLVGGGLALWSATAIATRILQAPETFGLARAAGALLALAVALAYIPPRWAMRRWGLESMQGEVLSPRLDPAKLAAYHAEMARRVQDLI